jgi:hypothetical protein
MQEVDGNPAIGQGARLLQVTVDGIGNRGTSTSTVALTDFTIVVNTSDISQWTGQLTMTLHSVAGIMAEYPSVVAVTRLVIQTKWTRRMQSTIPAMLPSGTSATCRMYKPCQNFCLTLTAVHAGEW